MKGKKYAYVEKKRCVACGECAFVCPRGAVSIKHGCFAEVDEDSCIGCGICSRHCPAGCIVVMERKAGTDEEE